MDEQLLPDDLVFLDESIAEMERTFDDPITIKRFSSQTSSPGVFQTPQVPTFTTFDATATLIEMNVASKYYASGILSAGDIVLEMRERLNEGDENIGGSNLADRVIFRGMEYRMVQRPDPVTFGGGLSGNVPFYRVLLRRTNSKSDTVGV